MALPWHIPLESLPTLKENPILPQSTLLQHYCNLNIHENPFEELQTGLMCDIGINNRDTSNIQRLIASGMTVARLKLREMEPKICAQTIQSIRQAVYNYSIELQYVYPLALMVDIRGPDIATGNLKGGPCSTIELIENENIRLTSDPTWRQNGTADCLYVGYDDLTDLEPGDTVFIDSLTPVKVKLIISEVGDDSLECLIATGGIIGSKMTVHISKAPRDVTNDSKGDSFESLSFSGSLDQPFESMDEQILWAIGSDIDGLLVPNIQSRHDIREVRDILSEKGKHVLVFACIDNMLGIDNIDEILAEADGVFVDRYVLSIDVPVEKIFIAQKNILAKCSGIGKPCICKAVINEQIPTLCVTDVANLVLDGAAVLSLEFNYDTPLKKFSSYDPIKMADHCLAAAAVICRHAERIVWRPSIYGNIELFRTPLIDPTKAVCVSAVELATRSRAVVILCLTKSGRTAKEVSHAKPPCPVVAVTRLCHSARQLRFWRGVRAVHSFEVPRNNWASDVESRLHVALDYCRAKHMLRVGDAYVTLTGSRRDVGYCDSIRLLYASVRNKVVVDYYFFIHHIIYINM